MSSSKIKLLLLHAKVKRKVNNYVRVNNFSKRKTIFCNPTKFSVEKKVVCSQNYWLLGELKTQSLTRL